MNNLISIISNVFNISDKYITIILQTILVVVIIKVIVKIMVFLYSKHQKSSKNNNIWVKIRVLNSDKEIIGETGLIKPGQYLESVTLTQKVKTNDQIIYKIMGYEKDEYISAGSISLNTRIGELWKKIL